MHQNIQDQTGGYNNPGAYNGYGPGQQYPQQPYNQNAYGPNNYGHPSYEQQYAQGAMYNQSYSGNHQYHGQSHTYNAPGYADIEAQSGANRGIFGDIPQDKLLTSDVDISIRNGFVRKVYGILSMQLLITFAMAAAFNVYRPAARWLYNNPLLLILSSVAMIASVCSKF